MFIGLGTAMWQVATQRFAALVQVTHFRRVVCRLVERNFGQLAVRNWQIEAVTEGLDVFVCQLLGLVNRVFAFSRFAHAKTLHGFDQQHGGLAFVIDGLVVSGVDLLRVMTTPL